MMRAVIFVVCLSLFFMQNVNAFCYFGVCVGGNEEYSIFDSCGDECVGDQTCAIGSCVGDPCGFSCIPGLESCSDISYECVAWNAECSTDCGGSFLCWYGECIDCSICDSEWLDTETYLELFPGFSLGDISEALKFNGTTEWQSVLTDILVEIDSEEVALITDIIFGDDVSFEEGATAAVAIFGDLAIDLIETHLPEAAILVGAGEDGVSVTIDIGEIQIYPGTTLDIEIGLNADVSMDGLVLEGELEVQGSGTLNLPGDAADIQVEAGATIAASGTVSLSGDTGGAILELDSAYVSVDAEAELTVSAPILGSTVLTVDGSLSMQGDFSEAGFNITAQGSVAIEGETFLGASLSVDGTITIATDGDEVIVFNSLDFCGREAVVEYIVDDLSDALFNATGLTIMSYLTPLDYTGMYCHTFVLRDAQGSVSLDLVPQPAFDRRLLSSHSEGCEFNSTQLTCWATSYDDLSGVATIQPQWFVFSLIAATLMTLFH